jgi:hypothetical protein
MNRRSGHGSRVEVLTMGFDTAEGDRAFSICTFGNLLTHYQIRKEQQVHEQKGHYKTDSSNPFSCGMFPYEVTGILIDRLSSLALSPINKLGEAGIPIPGINVFTSVLSPSHVTRSGASSCVRNVHCIFSIYWFFDRLRSLNGMTQPVLIS